MDNRLEIDDPKVKIVDGADKDIEERIRMMIVIGSNHIWKERYNLYKHVETDYCIYLDTDCVVINDRVDELIEESEDQFLVAQHWWVPTLRLPYKCSCGSCLKDWVKYLQMIKVSIICCFWCFPFPERISMINL